LTTRRGLNPRFFVDLIVIARSTCDEAIHLLAAAKRLDCFASLAMTVVAQAYRAQYLMCYKANMFQDRQTIASRVVLDDRSRLPWRFFGRLTTAALAA
jgi:hypothetical protein